MTTEPKPQLPKPSKKVPKEVHDAFSRCRISMMGSGSAFITSVCFSLKHIFTDDIPRAATDGKNIYFNPEWFMSIPHAQRVGVLVHEVWHVALNHCKLQKYSRLGTRNPMLWNISCDGIINNYVLDSGMELPDDRVEFPDHKNGIPCVRGMSTEQVYAMLEEKVKQQMPMPSMSPDDVDLLEPAPSDDSSGDSGNDPSTGTKPVEGQAKPEEMDMEMKQILVRAAIASKMAGEDPGKLPGEVQFILDKITKPKLPWNQLVMRYFKASAKTNYNFRRPNRRYFPKYYLPSKNDMTLDHVTMAIDMSGSVSDEEITQFIGEIAQVLRNIQPKKLIMLEFDTELKNVTEIRTANELLTHEFKGRGGTIIDPVMDYVNEHPTDLLIMFTDGYFYEAENDPTCPVLWVIYANPGFTHHYGKVIHAEI